MVIVPTLCSDRDKENFHSFLLSIVNISLYNEIQYKLELNKG